MEGLLKLTRAHTAPLEAVPATVGALLATGGSFTVGVFYWMLFGVGYHLVGYGHNSWTDWKNGHDKKDPNKQHHPLNTGDMDPSFARISIIIGVLVLLTYTTYGIVSSGELWVMLIAGIGVAAAWMYNEKGKETVFKFVYICIAHTTVFLVPYFAMGGELTLPLVSGAFVVIHWVMYQIAISGELKDLQTDEENLVRSYSVVDLNGDRRPSTGIRAIGGVVRVLIGAFAYVTAFYLGGGHVTALIIIALTSASVHMGDVMLKSKYSKRDEAVTYMSIIEMISLFIFITAFSPLYGLFVTLCMVTSSVGWVILLNKKMWKTTIKPDV